MRELRKSWKLAAYAWAVGAALWGSALLGMHLADADWSRHHTQQHALRTSH